MKKLVCILMCALLCGCGVNKHNGTLASGDVIDDKNIIIESIEGKNYSFEEIKMPDGVELDYFWSEGLYRDAENNDDEGKAILYLHRDGLFEKLERVPFGFVDEYGESTVDRLIWSTSDGEFVWFLGFVGEYNGKYIYSNEFVSSIYLLDENGAEDILPDKSYGFPIQEIQESDNYNFNWGSTDYLVDNSPLCGKLLAYYSDKYVEDGKPAHNYGVWVIDLETREEYRIDLENEANRYVTNIMIEGWLDDDTLLLKKNNELYTHKPSEGTGCELLYIVDSEKYSFSINGKHLCMSEKDGFGWKVIELDSMKEHYFDLQMDISVQDIYEGTKYLAISENQKAIILLDLETDTFETFEWEKDTYIEYAYFDESGNVIVVEEETGIVSGIYKLVNQGDGFVGGDELQNEDEAIAEYENYELIWDTSGIEEMSIKYVNSSDGNRQTLYCENNSYYIIIDSKPVELEQYTHTANYGEFSSSTDYYRLNGKLYHSEAVVSDSEYIVCNYETGKMTQLYLADIESDVLTPLLPDTAFGFSYDEYYALTSKWDTIYWCESFVLSPSKDKIAYWSNKATDGENPVYEGGIWIYDLKTGEEHRLNTSMCEGDVTSPTWVSNDRILFSYDNDGATVYSVYDLSKKIVDSEYSSFAISEAVDSNVMVYSLADFVEIIEFDSGKIHGFVVGNLLSFYSPDVVSTKNAVAFADRNNDVYVFDLDTDTYKVYESEFGENRIEVCDITENGDIIMIVLNTKSFSIEGIYRLAR